MSIQTTRYSRGRRVHTLVSCPFCGHDFQPNEPRWKHLLDEHDPEDAGLTPAGEIAPGHDAPLFGGVQR
ncbi:hypothetical protein [Salarchaeum japonicum]|uniref:hypothetical protein n=1 Tax=Salarchaeum japonicum TaxID=555573 RepID=UPI001D0AB462|nr:hypothetical protein [Salarchaeum japonicum]